MGRNGFIRLKLKHLADKFRFTSYFIKYMAARAVSRFYLNRSEWKHLWIVAERGTDARDNGYYMFCYLREKHPEINVRYIISEKSADALKVKARGDTIPFLSFRHYLAIALSEMKISTHIMGFTPSPYFFTKLELKGLVPGIKVFLQHGITKDNIPFFHYDNTRPDLFVCSAGKEKDYIKAVYGHPEGVVRLLGFCRYDGLPLDHDRTLSKIILLMPTWRQYLEGITAAGFPQTRYYQEWEGLLTDPALSGLLKKYGWKLIFYPHMEIQRFLPLFSPEDENILPASLREYDVQELLIKADILVTDYSSVYFDFGYMDKPVVYYQFDKEEYRRGHYEEGWFSYERDGFGPVYENRSQVILELERLILEGATMPPDYRRRTNELFGFHDHENCRRNFEAILRLWENRKEGR